MSRAEWLAARRKLLAAEKRLTREREALSARRRGLPAVEVTEEYLYPRFDGRSSLRTWLYRIVTNSCLQELEGARRRALRTGLGSAGDTTSEAEVAWLEPFPTSDGDPAKVVADRAGLRLALIAALQVLPARQRAVLIFRDVLRWRAAEVAEVLGVSAAAVNSLLQRAQLEAAGLDQDDVQEPSPACRTAFDRANRDAYRPAGRTAWWCG